MVPSDIEKHIAKHPAVQDVAVVGLPDETDGELPQAFIVLQKGYCITPEELECFVDGNDQIYDRAVLFLTLLDIADKLSREEKLRGGVFFVDRIPRNDSGKVLAQQLRTLAYEQRKIYSGGFVQNFINERIR